MSNLVPFDGGNVPDYLKGLASSINSDITVYASTGFPVISIKGKQFAVVRDGERKILPNPKDPESPATSIEVVVLKVNKAKSKVFYLNGYDPESRKKPDCFSNDSTKPDPSSEVPQAKLCMTCPHNQWGAKVTEGGKKGKACQDSVRIAVATADMLNDPYLLRVPPASIKALGEFGSQLSKRDTPYNAVVTKIGFDPTAESPKLTFRPHQFLDAAGYKEAEEVAAGDTVKNILGTVTADEFGGEDFSGTAQPVSSRPAPQVTQELPSISKDKQVTEQEVEAAIARAKSKSAQPVSKPAPVSKPTAEEIEVDLDLDDLSFDDE